MITPSVLIMIATFIILIIVEGIIGPLEAIKSIGNILSYARIMAIGTASVVLAIVANKLGGLAGNAILGILVAGMIHIINIFLVVSNSDCIGRINKQIKIFFKNCFMRFLPFFIYAH